MNQLLYRILSWVLRLIGVWSWPVDAAPPPARTGRPARPGPRAGIEQQELTAAVVTLVGYILGTALEDGLRS